MAQISRPFQVALVVIALFAAVWVFALHRHSAPSSASSAPVASSATTTPAPAAAKASASSSAAGGQGAASKIYHGSAPGVTGLTRAVAKAHGAVAASERDAKQFEKQSAETSSTASTTAASSTSRPAATSTTTAATKAPTHASGASSTHVAAPSRQQAVEAALKQGRVAVLLFWNPKGFDDALVHREVQRLASHKGIAVYQAAPSQVSSFGSITRGVQVDGTPTILIVAKSGKTTVLTGFTDVYSIEQAISETRHA
jgi:hypothetical protein